jgi:hypothetical protein
MATTGAAQLRREFWRQFTDEMAAHSSIGCSRVSSDGWMWHAADLTFGYLASLLNVRRAEIGVRYRLNDAGADAVFAFLESHRPAIDAAFDVPPTWRPGEGSSHVIEIMRTADVPARAGWAGHMRWLREQLETFQKALWPFVGRVPPAGQRRLWDEPSLLRELAAWNPSCLGPATAVLRWAQMRGQDIQWGRGGQTGSFTPTTMHRGVRYQLAAVRTDGSIRLLFARLMDLPPYTDHRRRLEIVERLNGVPFGHLPAGVIDARPSLPLAMLGHADACAGFVAVLDWFRGDVKTA